MSGGNERMESVVKDTLMNSDADKEQLAEALSDLIGHLSSEENLEMFTDLNRSEVSHLSVLRTVGDDVMDDFTRNFMLLKISDGRLGRRELIEVSESVGSQHQEEEGKKTLQGLRNLMG